MSLSLPTSERGLAGHANAGRATAGYAVAVVIVTYNSAPVLGMCLDSLRRQTRLADVVVIVDNNSAEPGYLDQVSSKAPLELIRNGRNDGFCSGNNTGYGLARTCEYVLFLNPDAFLSADFLEEALRWMECPENVRVGCLTGTLLRFDVAAARPTGVIDSTGIFQKWYGKWYDRAQGTPCAPPSGQTRCEDIPAACGALMFCRTRALEEIALGTQQVFDQRFFMYKEDIDLSLRLRARGWRIVYRPDLLCHHGRGWQGRTNMPYRSRYISARNELRTCWRNNLKGLPYSLLKFAYVTTVERLKKAIR
jgi:N-acetylglucosaminyl-diphospho-decaprenol L-rhamnosyltransferase